MYNNVGNINIRTPITYSYIFRGKEQYCCRVCGTIDYRYPGGIEVCEECFKNRYTNQYTKKGTVINPASTGQIDLVVQNKKMPPIKGAKLKVQKGLFKKVES